MTRDEKIELITKHLGDRGYNTGHVLALVDEVWGDGFRVGCERTRAVFAAPPKPQKPKRVRTKRAPATGNPGLAKALDTLMIGRKKK